MWRFRFVVLIFTLAVTTVSRGQRTYFEYNNPEAIKLNSKRLGHLTSRPWYIHSLAVLLRGDTAHYLYHGSIEYKSDGSYTFTTETGTWSIQYGKYIRHVPANAKPGRSLAGIFSVTSFTDSTLVLTKLQTSSHDMKRIFFLSSKPRNWPLVQIHRDAPTPVEQKQMELSQLRDPFVIDSISYLSPEQQFTSGFLLSEGRIRVETYDTTLEIKSKYGRAGNYRRVFSESEIPAAYPGRRTTPTPSEVTEAEKRVQVFINKLLKENGIDYSDPLDNQFRQFLGYTGPDGERFVYITWFCQYSRDWTKRLIAADDSPSCFFEITYNTKSKTCSGFRFGKNPDE